MHLFNINIMSYNQESTLCFVCFSGPPTRRMNSEYILLSYVVCEAFIKCLKICVLQTAGSMFQAARDDAEKQICDNLEKKVDEFLDLENYDWLLGKN